MYTNSSVLLSHLSLVLTFRSTAVFIQLGTGSLISELDFFLQTPFNATTMSVNLKPAFVRLKFFILPVDLAYESTQPFTNVEDAVEIPSRTPFRG